jgi:hypothetical protein
VPPPPPVDVLGADGFDRADSPVLGSADVGGAWLSSGGARFGVLDGAATVVAGAGEGVALLDVGHADASLEATLKLSTGRAAPGLSFRAFDAATQLYVVLEKRSGIDRIALVRVSGGSSQELTARERYGLVSGASYRVRVEAIGGEIRVFVDEQAVLEHVLTGTDASTFGAGTGFGLRTFKRGNVDDGGSTWDDVVVRSLTP